MTDNTVNQVTGAATPVRPAGCSGYGSRCTYTPSGRGKNTTTSLLHSAVTSGLALVLLVLAGCAGPTDEVVQDATGTPVLEQSQTLPVRIEPVGHSEIVDTARDPDCDTIRIGHPEQRTYVPKHVDAAGVIWYRIEAGWIANTGFCH